MIILGVTSGVASIMIDYRDLKALRVALGCVDLEQVVDELSEQQLEHHAAIVTQASALILSLEHQLGDAPKTMDERIMESLKAMNTKSVN